MILNRDTRRLFVIRFLRLFAYGALSVVLVLYLTAIGLSDKQAGTLMTMTLAGDTIVSLLITTRADRAGRRRMLIVGSALMFAAGIVFGVTRNYLWLMIAGTIGVISPSGNEVGPFLSIEQAALSHVVPAKSRTRVFGWHALTAAIGTAAGSLCGGSMVSFLQKRGVEAAESYRSVVMLYAIAGIALALLFRALSAGAEITSNAPGSRPAQIHAWLGLTHSKRPVLKLSALFALDAFAGGFVIQSFAAYWFYLRYGVSVQTLGAIFFGANLCAGISALLAARLAARYGLVNTMVFTHLPSNILLVLVPLMPNVRAAILVLLLRFSISQMDVPTRQSYLMAVVSPEERSAAAGVAGVARTAGAALAPALAGLLFANRALIDAPFFIAGGLKIVYDLLLYRAFIQIAPAEESRSGAP